MEAIDTVQISWLWKFLSAVSAIAAIAIGALWKRLETRVVILERDAAKHADVVAVNLTLRELSAKIDRFSERAEERGQRLMETMISTFRPSQQS